MDYSAEAWEPIPCEITSVPVLEQRLKGWREILATSWDMPQLHGAVVLDLWIGKRTWSLVQRTVTGAACVIAVGKVKQHQPPSTSNPEIDL